MRITTVDRCCSTRETQIGSRARIVIVAARRLRPLKPRRGFTGELLTPTGSLEADVRDVDLCDAWGAWSASAPMARSKSAIDEPRPRDLVGTCDEPGSRPIELRAHCAKLAEHRVRQHELALDPPIARRKPPIATITEPAAIRDILVHLGVRAEPLPRARARDPTGQESFDFDAA